MVMGILILSGAYNTAELFREKEFLRWLFGGILVVYGIFRAYNIFLKITQKPKKLRYYEEDDDEERKLL
jgi:hypothetical protein